MPRSLFRNKDLSLIVATRPVGNYDIYGRLIAATLEKFLQANKISIRNIPGNGMIDGANAIYRSQPDGLTFGTFNSGLLTAQLAGTKGIQFVLEKFTWLANATVTPRLLAVRADLPQQTIEDLQKSGKPLMIPSSGIGGSAYNDGMLLRNILNLNLEIIPYYGGAQTTEALQKGTVNGRIGSYAAVMKDIKKGLLQPVLQWGAKAPDLSTVPFLTDLASPPMKSLVALMDAMAAIGRPFAAPPGVPEEQKQFLRKAFQETLQDKGFLESAKKAKLLIHFQSGAELEAMIIAALTQDNETVSTLKKFLRP
ncbi:MAG: tripartite tricarboxylate transporter substrate-binding protein [Desulfobacterales bacterium]|nr:tripartite tricarboxylate transporter substrate-binding protein [Desulfobacterales bacterium]